MSDPFYSDKAIKLNTLFVLIGISLFLGLISCSSYIDEEFHPGLSSTIKFTSDHYMGADGAISSKKLIVTSSSGLLANDFSTAGKTLTITPGTFTTSLGGSVVISSDGSFVYTPPLGTSGNDSFTYQVSDTNGFVEESSATIEIGEVIWFVKNNAPSGGNGSFETPFQTLASAASAAGGGDTIYILSGDGTSTNQNSGIVLKDNQKLIGQGIALQRLGQTIFSASTTPIISNSSGAGVTLASGNEVRGIKIEGTTSAALLATNATTHLVIDQIEITGTAANSPPGIQLDNFTGLLEIYQSHFTTTHTNMGQAIRVTVLNDNTFGAVIAKNIFDGSSAGDITDAIEITVGTGSGTGTQNIRILENTMATIQGGSTQDGITINTDNDSSPDILIDGNSMSSIGDRSIFVGSNQVSTPRVFIANNNVSSSGGRGIQFTSSDSSGANVEVLNNTVTNSGNESIRVNSTDSSAVTADVNGNVVATSADTGIMTNNTGSGLNTHFNVRNNTMSGTPNKGFVVTFTDTSGGTTCSRFTGNDASSLTSGVADYRTNEEVNLKQSLEDTVGGSASVNTYVQAANTGFTSFSHANSGPGTLVSAGTCTLISNLRPAISDIADQTMSVSSALSGVAFTVSDTEDSATSLSVTVDTSDQMLLPNANITINHLGGGSRSLDLTPTTGLVGEVLVIVTVTDNSGLVSIEVFKVTIS